MSKNNNKQALLSAVKKYYEEKDSFEEKLCEIDTTFAKDENSFILKKKRKQVGDYAKEVIYTSKDLENRKNRIFKTKGKYEEILSEYHKWKKKNNKSNISNYKYLNDTGFSVKNYKNAEPKYIFNCLAKNFAHIHFPRRDVNGHLSRVEVYGPEADLQKYDNSFYFRNSITGYTGSTFETGNWYHDKFRFYLTFAFDPALSSSENGIITVKARVHCNGSCVVWQDLIPHEFLYTSETGVTLNASVDFAQSTPTGHYQIWEGDVVNLVDAWMSFYSAQYRRYKPLIVPIPDVIDIIHRYDRPLFGDRCFAVTVIFETNVIVDKGGIGSIEMEMTVPMVWSEVYRQ